MHTPAPTSGCEEQQISPWRVVHFILDSRLGGPHSYVKTLLSAQGSNVSSTVVTAGRGPMTDVALTNFRCIHWLLYPFEVLVNSIIVLWRYGLLDRRVLLHVHGAANVAPLLAAAVSRLPVVWHLHETVGTQRALSTVGSWLLRLTRHAVLTVACQGRAAYGQPHAVLAHGAIDTAFWRRPEPAPGGNQPSQILRLVTVANLNPLKGLDVLLTALAAVSGPVRLVIVGAELGSQRAHAATLRSLAVSLATRIPPVSVTFTGSLPPAEVRGVLLDADAFVLPSRSEACPIALLEAMALSLPCIATGVGDVKLLLPDIQQQFVCPPGDAAALAAAIDHLAAAPTRERQSIGAANRQAVEANHSPEALANVVSQTYRTLLREPTGTITNTV
jgi:glycosyltransferase involved in cell wall biosynthesis